MLSQKSEQKSAQEQMITNPDMMSNMMKQNLSGIVPQVPHTSSSLAILPHGEAEPGRHVHRVLLPWLVSAMPMHCAQSCHLRLCARRLFKTISMCMQIAMGAFVSYFFSGFILGKIPFPLSPSFRLMLQVPPRPPPCQAPGPPLLALACGLFWGICVFPQGLFLPGSCLLTCLSFGKWVHLADLQQARIGSSSLKFKTLEYMVPGLAAPCTGLRSRFQG